ncbi:TMEM43 family protein [Flammeovirga aprica]|uniref:Uncharacterized protein n=1 Tax=Flammeovirga aprica JL-4 TaxID=694437 RepID=A0A7X9P2Z2_9BACT|nr:TMEM43 family protein [Flammeovirga aprica]NME68603.1 hypothetical protein [Flammeovirga aprica JL-4]
MSYYDEDGYENPLSRIAYGIVGVIIGIPAFLFGTYLLITAEINYVESVDMLDSLKPSIKEADVNHDPQLDNQLVYYQDSIKTKSILTDEEFGVGGNFIKLHREVLMYQWRQKSDSKTKRDFDGGETTRTRYYYDKEWNSYIIDSDHFEVQNGLYINPKKMRYEDITLTCDEANMGRYKLGESVLKNLQYYTVIPPSEFTKKKIIFMEMLITSA